MVVGALGTSVGDAYASWARYYDWIYQGIADYEGDADFLESVFRRHGKGPIRSILDIGCGTGGHALPLARRGYAVVGVDSSRPMLTHARARARQAQVRIRFELGDMRDLHVSETFDAAVCMFGAFGYLTSKQDARRALLGARRHLRPGGLYLCELWNTAAVKPGLRSELHRDRDGQTLRRLSEAAFDPRRRILTITFSFQILQGGKLVDEFESIHRTRTYGLAEMRSLLQGAGLRVEALVGVEPKGKALGTPARGHFRVMAVARRASGPPEEPLGRGAKA